MRITARSRGCWRMISGPAANGMRCVKPSSARLLPSWTNSRMASLRDVMVAKAGRSYYDRRLLPSPRMHPRLETIAVTLVTMGLCSCDAQPNAAPAVIPSLDYSIARTYPHDPDAFTQGLLFHDGVLYESTGRNGYSSLRKVRLESGEVLQKIDVPDTYFAEGLALAGSRLVQLTWQSQVGFVYDLATFAKLGTFDYKGEGRGLTTTGTRLSLSHGRPS